MLCADSICARTPLRTRMTQLSNPKFYSYLVTYEMT